MQFIIHELLKDKNGRVKTRYRDSVIDPSQQERDFIEQVTKLFRRHQAGRIYGNFEEDTTSYPFSRLLAESLDPDEFYNFSKKSAAHLVEIMGAIPAATGGYYFVVGFGIDGVRMVLVFMLSQEMGHAVNQKTLTLEKVLNLELEHMDLAALINIDDWQQAKAEPVSLIRGRKEVSDYFKRFIGLHEPRTNTEGTKKLKAFVDQWMEGHKYAPAAREDVRTKLLEYAKERGDQAVELNVIAPYVDPNRTREFFEKANEAGLGSEFHIDRRSLAAWDRLIYQDRDIKISLAKRQLKKRFTYDRTKKTLLIRDIELSDADLQ